MIILIFACRFEAAVLQEPPYWSETKQPPPQANFAHNTAHNGLHNKSRTAIKQQHTFLCHVENQRPLPEVYSLLSAITVLVGQNPFNRQLECSRSGSFLSEHFYMTNLTTLSADCTTTVARAEGDTWHLLTHPEN